MVFVFFWSDYAFMQIRKTNGDRYHRNSLLSIANGLERHLKAKRQEAFNSSGAYPFQPIALFQDDEFAQFRTNLDKHLEE